MTTKTYHRPTDAELPAALAKEMGLYLSPILDRSCKRILYHEYHGWPKNSKGWGIKPSEWNPLTDRNHIRLAVERVVELGLMLEFESCLEYEQTQAPYHRCLATPAQESHAAYKVLFEHNRKEKP